MPENDNLQRPFKIAIREEGEWVNGYVADYEDTKARILVFKISVNALNMGGEQAFEALKQFAGVLATGMLTSIIPDLPANDIILEFHISSKKEK